MLPSPLHILVTRIYRTYKCNALAALQSMADGLKHMKTCPHHKESEIELQEAIIDEMKILAVEDMKLKGKWN